MFIYCLFLLVESALWSVSSVDIGLAGEVGFELRPAGAWSPRGRGRGPGAAGGPAPAPPGLRLRLDSKGKPPGLRLRLDSKGKPPGLRLRLDSKGKPPSETPACVYQLPKTKQVNAIMSNMMNVLTKIFTRSRELCDAAPRQRGRGARFRVVGATHSAYFDQIYSNMTQEFNKSYARVLDRLPVKRAGGACAPQAEARRLWRGLLARAHAGLHRAAARLIHHHLRAAGCSRAEALESELGAFLSREQRRLRARTLDALCQRRRQCRDGLS